MDITVPKELLREFSLKVGKRGTSLSLTYYLKENRPCVFSFLPQLLSKLMGNSEP